MERITPELIAALLIHLRGGCCVGVLDERVELLSANDVVAEAGHSRNLCADGAPQLRRVQLTQLVGMGYADHRLGVAVLTPQRGIHLQHPREKLVGHVRGFVV